MKLKEPAKINNRSGNIRSIASVCYKFSPFLDVCLSASLSLSLSLSVCLRAFARAPSFILKSYKFQGVQMSIRKKVPINKARLVNIETQTYGRIL